MEGVQGELEAARSALAAAQEGAGEQEKKVAELEAQVAEATRKRSVRASEQEHRALRTGGLRFGLHKAVDQRGLDSSTPSQTRRWTVERSK